MTDATRKSHWDTVYTTKGESEVSWFQENPAPSLELIDLARPAPESAIVDIGGGRHAWSIAFSRAGSGT